jgi:hypothetical protein
MRRLVFVAATTLLAALGSSAPHPQTGDDAFEGGNTDDTTVAEFAAIRSTWERIWNSRDPAIDQAATAEPADEKTVLQQRLVELTRDLSSQMTTTELKDAVAAAELNSKARQAQQKLDRAAAILKEVADQHPETPAGLAANRAINVLFRPTQELMIGEVPESEPMPIVAFGDAIEFAPDAIRVQDVTPLFAPDARPTWGGVSMPLGTPIQPLSDLPSPFQGPDKLDVDSAVPSEVPNKVRLWDSIIPLTSRPARFDPRFPFAGAIIYESVEEQSSGIIQLDDLQHVAGVPMKLEAINTERQSNPESD